MCAREAGAGRGGGRVRTVDSSVFGGLGASAGNAFPPFNRTPDGSTADVRLNRAIDDVAKAKAALEAERQKGKDRAAGLQRRIDELTGSRPLSSLPLRTKRKRGRGVSSGANKMGRGGGVGGWAGQLTFPFRLASRGSGEQADGATEERAAGGIQEATQAH